jgi:hypothetical protein
MRLPAVVGLALAASAGLFGCQAHSTAVESPVVEAQTADDELLIAEIRSYHRYHHRGGVTEFVAMGLDTLAVDEPTRGRVEKLQSELMACLAPTRDSERKLLLTLADGIAAGKVVRSGAVDDSILQLTTAANAQSDCKPDALNQLHATLSPAEREALVDKVEAHWEIWQKVNDDEAEARGHEQSGRLAELTNDVGLTPAQAEAVSTMLESARAGTPNHFDRANAQARLRTFVAKFPLEVFDAKSVVTKGDDVLVTHGATRLVRFYEAVTPMLTAEQRQKLATHLRDHANHQTAVSAK